MIPIYFGEKILLIEVQMSEVEKLPTVFASLSQREERANSQAMMSCEVGKSDGVP
jgi:hypothetical protein